MKLLYSTKACNLGNHYQQNLKSTLSDLTSYEVNLTSQHSNLDFGGTFNCPKGGGGDVFFVDM
jgi:hypothetical protein